MILVADGDLSRWGPNDAARLGGGGRRVGHNAHSGKLLVVAGEETVEMGGVVEEGSRCRGTGNKEWMQGETITQD